MAALAPVQELRRAAKHTVSIAILHLHGREAAEAAQANTTTVVNTPILKLDSE